MALGKYPAGKPHVRCTSAVAAAQSDTVDLPKITSAVLIGVAGNLRVIMANDTTPVTLPVPAGILALCVKRIFTTSTTATGIFCLY